MNAAGIFISYTTADKAIVAEIRKAFEGQGLTVWVDSRELSAGDDLDDTIREKIEQAAHFMVVLSPKVISSARVGKEIKHALKIQKRRSDGCKVIPILLDGVQPAALRLWFGNKDPLAVSIGSGHDAVAKALPELLAAVRIDPTANRDVPHSSPRSRGTGGDIVQDGAVCGRVDPIGSSCRPLTHSAPNRSSRTPLCSCT